MLEALKRLLSPEYLVVTEPGPLGSLWVLYVTLGLLFGAGLVGALWILLAPGRSSRSTALRGWAWYELWICLAGSGSVFGRFLGWPGWSARIWPYSLALLAMAGVLAYRLRHLKLPPSLSTQFRILALTPNPSPMLEREEIAARRAPPLPQQSTDDVQRLEATGTSILPTLLGLTIHLLGIALILAARYGWPAWTAMIALLGLLAPQLPLILRRRRPSLMALTPMLAAYLATCLWLLYRGLGITIIGWQGLAFPNPLVSLLYTDAITLAAVTYTLLCETHVALLELGRPQRLWRWAVAGLLVVTLAWTGMVYFGKRTHGATASDPYAYAQMGVDLAETGSFLHRFSLFEQVIPLNIAWAPLQPVGYHIPRNDLGDCPSVWATGASVLLAAGYRLLGETGLYITTPIVALLALAATWALVQETLPGEPRAVRYLAAALAVSLLATSPEYVDRLLVPMADASAQLFTVLTLLFTLQGMRQLAQGRRSLGSFVLAGICFGWAFWVRHTQLVLALPVVLAVLGGNQTYRRTLKVESQASNVKGPSEATLHPSSFLLPLAAFFGAALVAALPDIVYRWRVFGGLLATETTELHLMALQHIAPVAWQTLREVLVAGEWGYLFPLALYGGYRLGRERYHESIVLGSAFLVVLLVHLTYRSLRLRDLISLFPLVDLAVAFGAVSLVRRVRTVTQGRMSWLGPALLGAGVVAWVILGLALSRWAMIDNLWKPGWASFGYMRAEHRAAFDRLAELTPPEAIIGASLNAGAVMIYTGRDAIRPYDSWTAEEWGIFLSAMRASERPVYLLDDGGLMAEFIEQEKAHHGLSPIEELAIPLFYTRDREAGWLYLLEPVP